MTSSDSSTKYSAARDPLGEIKRRAKQLWTERGQATQTTWEDFVEEAEQELLSGKSGGLASDRKPVDRERFTVSPEIERLRADSSNPLLTALARGFPSLLDYHEIFCLTQLLVQHSLILAPNEQKITPSDEQIAEVLGSLAGEYPEEALSTLRVQSWQEIPLGKRIEYWRGAISKWRDKDRPLTFTDRNTMRRLQDLLLEAGALRAVEPR